MQKVLSIVLSFTLLFNTLAPAFAGVKRFKFRPPSTELPSSVEALFSRKLDTRILEQIACEKAAGARIEEALRNWRQEVVGVTQQSDRIIKDFAMGQYDGLGKEILSMSTPDKTLMQNELVGLFLSGTLSAYERGQAISFFEESLADAKKVFGAVSIPERYLITDKNLKEMGFSGILQNRGAGSAELENIRNWVAQDPAISAVFDLLLDAVAVGVMGAKNDVPALIELYEASIGTPFEAMTGRVVLYTMLHLRLYDKLFTFFDNPLYPDGKYIDDFVSQLPQELQRFFHKPKQQAYQNGVKSNRSTSGFYGQLELNCADYLERIFEEELKRRGPFAELMSTRSVYKDWPGMECRVLKPDWATINARGVEFWSNPRAVSSLQEQSNVSNAIPASRPLAETDDAANVADDKVYAITQPPVEEDVVGSEDASSLMFPTSVVALSVRGGGFQLAEVQNGRESVFRRVYIEVPESIKAARYNRITQNEAGYFELRSNEEGVEPQEMKRFYFQLSPENGALSALIDGVGKLRRTTLTLKIRSTHEKSFVKGLTDIGKRIFFNRQLYATIPLKLDSQKGSGDVLVELDVSLLPKECVKRGINGVLIVRGDQVFYEDKEGSYLLEDFYVRLPKKERNVWMRVMRENPQQEFRLTVWPTENKTRVLQYIAPVEFLGTGKAFGPFLKSLGLSPLLSSLIPLVANNAMSLLLLPIKNKLRKYGEANVYRAGLGIIAATFVGALCSGLNGFGGGIYSPAQTGALVAFLYTLGLGVTLARNNQNTLIQQNTGGIRTAKRRLQKWEVDRSEPPTLRFLARRVKEVFTSKKTEIRDSVLYQVAFMMKNLGTFGFLAVPFLFNEASAAMGSSVRADFSLGFWLLAGISLYTFYKAMRLPLKDTFIRKTDTLRWNLKKKEYAVISKIHEQLAKPEEEQEFGDIAQDLRESIAPLAQALSYKEKDKDDAAIFRQLESETLDRLRTFLIEDYVSVMQAAQVIDALQNEFNAFVRQNIKYKDVMAVPGMGSALAGMMLATIHELGTASGFAYAIGQALENIGYSPKDSLTTGAFLSAVFLYGTSFLSRLGGNKLAVRISEGSMYGFSSLCSVIGTALMIAGVYGNLPMLLTGVVLTGFGTGNFYSQVFDYTQRLPEKIGKDYRTEVSFLIGLTMPFAAFITGSFQEIVKVTGATGVDFMISGAALLGSLIFTRRMFEDSSIVRSARYYWQKLKDKIHRNEPPAEDPPVEEKPSIAPARYVVPVHG